ncbi:MAG: DUF493 domain-containing protein [Gammaproteobacteria bacterium]|jgi:uncharacterized protein|nr:DUF493 domain-containing protein [Gammaproteobacteria bacterium]MBT7307701.1 DUF493 domain-containing protein [Gammaproteobacteria bacterium]MBT7914780.1 DUF493 domain-containing protein [Candidatus Bathyarchaeota archaeon]
MKSPDDSNDNSPQEKQQEHPETLLEFPCPFAIKAMGKAGDDFDAHVAALVRNHVPQLGEGAVRSRPSKKGNYLAVTVTITATSKQQLDAIYFDLTADERIVMAL